ncbi:Crp/Fnr family transcriptional regulator [Sphingobacterium sp. N143]|nr:Crp/Fnr family transcriptional regulator [Sphingobacterium sp. N143]
MYQILFNYIHNYSQMILTSEEMELIKNTFQPKKLRKRQYFLQEGDISKFTAFITKGAMRQYYVDEKGVENVINLFIENYWATDRKSFFDLKPSIFYIDAWENTDLLIITRADMAELMKKIPAINEMIRIMDDKNAIASQNRINAAISISAEMRYENFLKSYPQFIQRFPQHQIASFLGITKETLSRIKKKTLK